MWIFKDKEILNREDLFTNCSDFVYIISYTNGQQYIGKKNILSKRRKPPLKGQKRHRILMTKHPFIDYTGSHKSASDLTISKKEILYQCSAKKAATYLEAALLFHYDAIFDPHWLNENISATFYKNSLDGLLKE